MATQRKAALAGSWYPGTGSGVAIQARGWEKYIAERASSLTFAPKERQTVVGIVPHAGWVFSGKLAAAVMGAAKSLFGGPAPELVVVLGGHLPPGAPLVGYPEDAWETPDSQLELAPELNAAFLGESSPLPFRTWSGATSDNTIEVELPLIKLFFPEARALALRAAPDAGALTLAKTLADLADGKRALILASTDLTHYGEAYGFAPAGGGAAGLAHREKNDKDFIAAALALQPREMLELGNRKRAACSAGAAAAAALIARDLGLTGQLADYYSSSDISNSDDLSVGYAGIVYA